MLPEYLKGLADDFVKHRVVQFDAKGGFNLRHGGKDWIYFNLRPANSSKLGGGITPEMAIFIGHRLDDLVEKHGLYFSGVAGVPYAGDPLAEVLGSIRNKLVLRLGKGRDGAINGFRFNPCPRGAPILLIENVTTSGISAANAALFLRLAGYTVDHVFSVIDRESGAWGTLGIHGIHLISLMKMSDLLDYYVRADKIPFELRDLAMRHAQQLRARPSGPLQ